MQSFAQDTRHRIRDPSDESAITLKFLCTQLPHWELVYPHIADDLESVNYRAPNMLDNYAKYKHIAPEVLSQLTNVPISSLLVDHFAETVGLPADKKTYGFFLLGQKHKNLDKHIEHLLPAGDDHFAERKRLFKAIQDFELPSDPSVIEQMVDILTKIPKGEMIQDVKEEGEVTKKPSDFVELDRKIALPDPPSPPPTDLQDHPLVTEFKQLAGLASHFPTKKVANQILGNLVGLDVSKHMGKFQTEVPNLSSGWEDLLQLYPLQELIETPEMEEFYYHLKEDKKPKDKLECVQMYLKENGENKDLIKKLLV